MACEYCDADENARLPHDRFASDSTPEILHYEGLRAGEGEACIAIVNEGVSLYIPAGFCIKCGREL